MRRQKVAARRKHQPLIMFVAAAVFWVKTPYSLVMNTNVLEEDIASILCPCETCDMFLRNVDNYLPHYTVS
jgi:hypothetical protein